MSVLALAERTLCAVLNPRGPGEADHTHLVQAGLGDVIADGVSLAGVGDTARAALTLREDTELTLHIRAGQGPAVDLPLQAAALLAALDPGVTTVVHRLPVLVEALTAEPGVTLRAAEKINCGILTVADHPSTHDESALTRAHGAAVALQHPDLPAVLHPPVVDAVPGAVLAMRAPAVIATIQVEANGVVGTAVPPGPTLVNIFARLPTRREQPVVMVAVPALAVVPSRQVNAVGAAVTLHKAFRAFINVCFTAGSGEALGAGTHVSCDAGSSISTAIFAKCFARGSVAHVARLADTVVSSHGVEAQGVVIAVVLTCGAFVVLCTRVIVNADVACPADAHEGAGGVDAHCVLAAVVAPLCTLIHVFTVGTVLSQSPEAISTAANGPVVQTAAHGVLHAAVPFRAEVITFTDFAAAMRQGDLLRLRTVQSWTDWTLDKLHGLILALIQDAHSRGGVARTSLSFKVGSSLKLANGFALLTAPAVHVRRS